MGHQWTALHANRRSAITESATEPNVGAAQRAPTRGARFTVGVLLREVYVVTGQRPTANILIAPVAFVFWWIPPLIQENFYIWIVPFFHSLQYLGFVYKIEGRRLQTTRPGATPMWGGITAMALVVAGFVTFELIPNTADHFFDTQGELGAWFFFASAVVFINVHHYFIDNVIWRFSNKRIRQFLLS